MFGGIVFYIDSTGQHGLVAAMEDIGEFAWGCNGTNISGADGQDIGTGFQNTLDIVAGCTQSPIAASEVLAYQFGGYSDLYLPSKDELVEMYYTIGNGGLYGNIAEFNENYNWSSTETSVYGAFLLYLTNGFTSSGFNLKGSPKPVRAIRSF